MPRLERDWRVGWDRPLDELGRTGPRDWGTTRPRPVASVLGRGRLPDGRVVAGSSEPAPALGGARFGSLLMGMERPGTRAEQIAGQLFALGKVQSAAEIVARLDAIDASIVKRYAARVMQEAKPAIAAVGPVERLEPYAVFARRFGSAGASLPDAAE